MIFSRGRTIENSVSLPLKLFSSDSFDCDSVTLVFAFIASEDNVLNFIAIAPQ